jgi:hypothetical protein
MVAEVPVVPIADNAGVQKALMKYFDELCES